MLQINTIYKSSGTFWMPISKAKVDYIHSGSINLKFSCSCRHRYWIGNFVEYLQNKFVSKRFQVCNENNVTQLWLVFHSRSLTSKAMILSYMSLMSLSFLCRCLLRLFRWPVTTTRNGSQLPVLHHSILQSFCLFLLCVIWSHWTNKKNISLKRPH